MKYIGLITRHHIVKILGIVLALYVVVNIFIPMEAMKEDSIFLGLLLLFIFLQPKKSGSGQFIFDLILSLATIAIFGYVWIEYKQISWNGGALVTLPEVILGIILIPVSLEAARRKVGWAVPIVVAVFIAYAFLGGYIPYKFGGTGGFNTQHVVYFLYLSDSSIFGEITYVIFKYVFVFVLFGAVLTASGATSYIIDLANYALGRFRGGPAMIAVFSSGLVGMVSGSAVANVMICGNFTIPLMRSTGYKPQVAGAIEAAASTGGQLMPPVMGAAAFLMMDFLGVTYLAICKAAIIPAVFYFLGILLSAYFLAVRSGMQRMPAEQLPKGRQLIRIDGLMFFGSLGSLIAFLIMGYSPMLSALYAIGINIVLSQFSANRITPRRLLNALSRSSEDFAPIGGACAAISLLVGVTYLTGLGVRLSAIMVNLAGTNLLLLLFLAMFVSIILGMGMPTTIVYIILAVMVAPALITLKVLPMAAHLFIFYMGMMSMVTPPVALAAYAASTIAKTSFWKIGWYAMLFAIIGFIIPYAFVYNNSLLMVGSPAEILVSICFTGIGLVGIAFGTFGIGHMWGGTISNWLVRGMSITGGIITMGPDLRTRLIGLALVALAAVLFVTSKSLMRKGVKAV